MKNIIAFICGVIFAIGLGLSGMTNPQKVISFLDLAGNWDPSLIFVMIGAIGINVVLFFLILRRQNPVCEKEFHLPNKKNIDISLIIGSAIFGIGWGLSGFCPGPAIFNLVTLDKNILIFFAAMMVGMYTHKLSQKK